jgi:hypothetical protein
MSQDTSEDTFAALQERSDLFERLLDEALGGPDSRWSRIFKSLTDEELTTLLMADWNRDDRGLEAEAFTIWDEKLTEHK